MKLEQKIENEERSGVLSRLRDSKVFKNISKTLIPLMAAGWMYFGDADNAKALVADTNGQQTGNTFRTTSEAVCKEDGKPIIRFFSSKYCGPCRWIKDTYDSVVKEYAKQGKIKAYRWELDTKDDELTPGVEGKIPDSELSVFNKYGSMGGTPLFVFGCKYVRVGNGYNNLNVEEKEFRQIIDSLIKEANISPKNSVLIFVDSDTYSKLSDRILRYKEDIENDSALNADVGVFQNNWKDINEIRNIILDHYNNRGLLGSIFIGDVPTAHFERKNGGGDIISDVYFSDLDNRFSDADNDGKFELETLNLPKEVWSARIKSPIDGEEGIGLLTNYFDRNHAYRRGEIKFEQRMMFFDNFSDEWRSKEQLMTELEDLTKSPALYGNMTDIAFFYHPHIDVTELFLSEIKKPYEFGYLIVHGFEKNNIIYYDKIKEVGSNVFFLILNSCHNGDFKTENYIAGWYLFSGNSLVVEAMTTASCALSRTDEIIRYKQANTLTFGEIYKDNTAIVVHLFGDPTLRFRMQPQKRNEEIISKIEEHTREEGDEDNIKNIISPLISKEIKISLPQNLSFIYPSISPDGTKLFFGVSGLCGSEGVYTANSDGGNLRKIGYIRNFGVQFEWSKDGRKIVFSQEAFCDSSKSSSEFCWNHYSGGKDELARFDEVFVTDPTKDADTTNLKRVTFASKILRGSYSPSWSPNGDKIVFNGRCTTPECYKSDNGFGNYEIYAVEANNPLNITNISNNPADDYYPRWSPDGSTIAYISKKEGKRYVYLMNPNGSNQRNITNHLEGAGLYGMEWLPDSRYLILSIKEKDEKWMDLYLLNTRNGNLINITNTPSISEEYPTISSNGKIVFLQRKDYNVNLSIADINSFQSRLTLQGH